MGFLDKIKGLFGGNKPQVDKGIDTAAGAAKKVVPDEHDAKVDQAAEKVKDVVGDMTGDDDPPTPPASADHAQRPDPHRHPLVDRPARRTRRPDATEGHDPSGSRPFASGSPVVGQLVLDLVDGVLDLAGRLVDLALAPQVIVVGQVADRLLDAALGLIGSTTHPVVLSSGRRGAGPA